MANSKTRAWFNLGEIVGHGRQSIDYRTATTVSINRHIEIIRERIFEEERIRDDEERQIRGREMYNKSVRQKTQDDKIKDGINPISKHITIKIRLKSHPIKKKINEDKCAICHDKFDLANYNDILMLKCNHTFHHSCIRNLLFIYMDDKCPLCRTVYEYRLDACRKIKQRLKKKIINHHKNECDRIEVRKLLDLALFLSQKNIVLGFLNDFINDIKHIPIPALVEMGYCELDRGHIYLFNEEYCGGDRTYKQHCRCRCGCDENMNHCNH